MASNLAFLAVSDIDGTIMTRHPTASEIRSAEKSRAFYDRYGTFTAATAQTAEMLMSSTAYDASVARGFTRPKPLLRRGSDGIYTYVPPESLRERRAFTDPELIMSMGTGCYRRRADGSYTGHKHFHDRLGRNWRRGALRLLTIISESGVGDLVKRLSSIEFEENYRFGKTDVFPLEYRIQLEFADPELTPAQNEQAKNQAKWRIQAAVHEIENVLKLSGISCEYRADTLKKYEDVLDNLIVVDESRPEKNRFQIYLMPKLAPKDKMIDDGLIRLTKGETIKHLDIFGDMPPDLKAGCFAGRAEHATFVLVGGSPLTEYFVRSSNRYRQEYAGEDLSWMRNHLIPTDQPGVELFCAPNAKPRRIILGDVAYPNRIGPETIDAYIEDQYKKTLH